MVDSDRSLNKNIRHTVYFRKKLYTEAPKMEYKRQSNASQGPKQKIRKIVHMSPDVEQMLKQREVMEARLQVRHEGDRVFVFLRPAANYVQAAPNVPRNEPRPKPIRPAGR